MCHVLNGLTINGVEVDWYGAHSRIMFRSILQMGSYSSRVKMGKQVEAMKRGLAMKKIAVTAISVLELDAKYNELKLTKYKQC